MDARMKKISINEVTILSKLDNPYVVKYFDSFFDKNILNIIMEFCEGGDLSNYLRAQMGI
jgi:NIMA (never in mitosis gene a)-related kinase